MKGFSLLLFFTVVTVSAESFNISLLYPINKNGVSYIGGEAVCISEGLLKEFNHPQVSIKYQIVDTAQSKLKTAVAVQKIIKSPVDLIVGTTYSDTAIVASKILTSKGIPFIVPTSTNPKVTKLNKLTLRICYDDFVQAHKLALLSNNYFKAKKILVLTNKSSEFSSFLSSQFIKKVRANNSSQKITEYKFISGSYNVSRLINKISNELPDLIVTTLQASKSALLYNEMKKNKHKPVLLGSDSIGGRKSFFEIIGQTDKKIKFYFLKQWDGKLRKPYDSEYNFLHQKYCNGYEKTTMSASAFDALKIALNTISKSYKSRGLKFIKKLKESKFDGLTGSVKYERGNTPSKPVFLYEVRENTIKFVKKI